MALARTTYREIIQKATGRSRALLQYFSAQTVTIAANLFYGLLCVRILPSAEYAKFVVLFGVQGTILVLMDVNLSGTLIPLIGDRINHRQLIADYVASLRQLSIWLFAIVGIGTACCYPLLVKHRHWSWLTVASMVVILLVSTWFVRIGSAYGTVLIVLRQRSLWYRAQMISSLGTLGALGIFWAFHWLGAFTAISINVLGLIYVGADYYVHARRHLVFVGSPRSDLRKAIIGLALPNIPQALFFALQGQISLFLITFLGHTQGVASVGALARLGQIFIIFKQGNMLFVEPYFAKLGKGRMRSAYLITLFLAGSVCGIFMVIAHFTPEVLLWLLGPQYSGLRTEVQIAIAAGAISFFSSVLWSIHSARRFVYWWNVGFSIILTLVVQLFFILKIDMSTVRGVLLLMLVTNAASLLTNVCAGLYGFIKGPRETEIEQESVQKAYLEEDPLLDIRE